MKCKKCNYELEKKWKFCPVCSEPIKKIKENCLSLIICSTILSLILYLWISKIITNNILEEERTKRYLEKTYNEKFDTITFIQSTKNSDTNLGCDGSSFGTIKGKGYTESYLVHSKKENLDFIIFYDTNTKKYNDNYEYSLKLRKCVGELYEEIKSTFYKYNEKITFSNDIHNESITPKIINSKQDLYDLLVNLIMKHHIQDYICMLI